MESFVPTLSEFSFAHVQVYVYCAVAVFALYWGLCLCLAMDKYTRSWKNISLTQGTAAYTRACNHFGKKLTVEDMDPPFPNGWYCLCFARELVAGQVRHVHCLGLDIALYRGTSKPYAAHAIYSYCPHLGANIAVGGTVEGDCVVCPFHGWSFDSDGTCTRIPGLAQVPALAHTTSFIIVEKNGMVWLWHHAARQKPYFDVLDVPEMVDSRAWFAGQTEHTVACHITEIPENGSDVAHLHVLHSPLIVNWLRPLFCHSWSATWDVDPSYKERSKVVISESLIFLGLRVPFLDVRVEGFQAGPGMVILRLLTPMGFLLLCETVLPLQPMLQRVVHSVYCGPFVPRLLGVLYLRALVIQFERDVPIWSNKVYLQKPVLTSQDGPIGKYRRWFSQFYCDESKRFADALEEEKSRRTDW